MTETFLFYLNGKLYGIGSAEYMTELFRDYVVVSNLYGRNDVNIEIKKMEGGVIND